MVTRTAATQDDLRRLNRARLLRRLHDDAVKAVNSPSPRLRKYSALGIESIEVRIPTLRNSPARYVRYASVKSSSRFTKSRNVGGA